MSDTAQERQTKAVYIVILCIIMSSAVVVFQWFAEKKVTVFVVSSYAAHDPCGWPQYEGVVAALVENVVHATDLKTFFLNARHASDEAIETKLAEVQEAAACLKPKVIITIDDKAFYEISRVFAGRKDVDIVFSGLNIPIEEYNKQLNFLNGRRPVKNITGVFEFLHFKRQMDFAATLMGKIPKVALIHSTDHIGLAGAAQILQELKGTDYEDRVVLYPASDMKQLLRQAEVIAADPDLDSYIPLAINIKQHDGQQTNVCDLALTLIKIIKKPDLVFNSSVTSCGFLGGASVDFRAMGYDAGTMANLILSNVPVSSLEVMNATKWEVVVNQQRLKELFHTPPAKALGIIDRYVEDIWP